MGEENDEDRFQEEEEEEEEEDQEDEEYLMFGTRDSGRGPTPHPLRRGSNTATGNFGSSESLGRRWRLEVVPHPPHPPQRSLSTANIDSFLDGLYGSDV